MPGVVLALQIHPETRQTLSSSSSWGGRETGIAHSGVTDWGLNPGPPTVWLGVPLSLPEPQLLVTGVGVMLSPLGLDGDPQTGRLGLSLVFGEVRKRGGPCSHLEAPRPRCPPWKWPDGHIPVREITAFAPFHRRRGPGCEPEVHSWLAALKPTARRPGEKVTQKPVASDSGSSRPQDALDPSNADTQPSHLCP